MCVRPRVTRTLPWPPRQAMRLPQSGRDSGGGEGAQEAGTTGWRPTGRVCGVQTLLLYCRPIIVGWPRPASGRVGACHRDRSTREQQIGHTEAEVTMGCPQAVVCVGLGRARVQTLGKMGVDLLRARERGPEPGPRVLVPRVNPRLPLTCLPCYSRCRPHRRLAAG